MRTCIRDNEGNTIISNPSAARIYGYDTAVEIIGASALWYYKNPNKYARCIG